MTTEENDVVKKEIYTYEAPWTLYAMHWSYRADKPYRLALGSFREEYTNKVLIVQLNQKTGEFEKKAEFDHPYPPTKIMWIPDKSTQRADLIATTGDYLRIWEVSGDDKVNLKALLNNVLLGFALFICLLLESVKILTHSFFELEEQTF
jgi:WD repeat-containing protein 68